MKLKRHYGYNHPQIKKCTLCQHRRESLCLYPRTQFGCLNSTGLQSCISHAGRRKHQAQPSQKHTLVIRINNYYNDALRRVVLLISLRIRVLHFCLLNKSSTYSPMKAAALVKNGHNPFPVLQIAAGC